MASVIADTLPFIPPMGLSSPLSSLSPLPRWFPRHHGGWGEKLGLRLEAMVRSAGMAWATDAWTGKGDSETILGLVVTCVILFAGALGAGLAPLSASGLPWMPKVLWSNAFLRAGTRRDLEARD